MFWRQAAVSMLKQDYKEGEMTLPSALALAVKVLNKTMDVSKLSAEKGELNSCFIVIFSFVYREIEFSVTLKSEKFWFYLTFLISAANMV